MIVLFTIGYTKKSAEKFFDLLKLNGVVRIVDTRVSNGSQLAGFAKSLDLQFFAHKIAQIGYRHFPEFAPTLELMRNYRKKKLSWEEYSAEYLKLLETREVIHNISIQEFSMNCLLCTEHLPDFCHRRLLAEHLRSRFTDIEIRHLV